MDRDIIFISHANPEDNKFAIWIASRLQALGYSTWVDKEALIGGEKFWQEIDYTIRCKVIKLLLVYTDNICVDKQPGRLRDSIEKELSLAESIAKQNKISDFIILLNIEGAIYNLFIGSDRLNQISFKQNWAEGLKLLIEKLSKDNVPKASNNSQEFSSWYENHFITTNGIIPKRELYYSSFWCIHSIPDKFYIFQFESLEDAQSIYESNTDFPVAKISNILTSFESSISQTYYKDNIEYVVKLKGKYVLNTIDIINGTYKQNSSFPTIKDGSNLLKSLLSRVFHLLMKQRKMFWYELADRSQSYYHTPVSLRNGWSKFIYPYRKNKTLKRKSIYGKYLNMGFWHFAVSSKPIFEPFLGYNLRTHIVFTTDGFKAWEDNDKMHTHRRRKGRRFFNAEWRDMLISFIHSLRDKENEIKIKLNLSFVLKLSLFPELYWSKFGYFEPQSSERFDILYSFEEDDSTDTEKL